MTDQAAPSITPPGSSAETVSVEEIAAMCVASSGVTPPQRDWLILQIAFALKAATAAERARCAKVALRLSKRTRTDNLFIAESGIEENMGKNIANAIEQPEEER